MLRLAAINGRSVREREVVHMLADAVRRICSALRLLMDAPALLLTFCAGVCGNDVCETGEMARSSPDYCPADCPQPAEDSCPVPTSQPAAVRTSNSGLRVTVGQPDAQCNGRGLCIALSRACNCFHGYAGPDCTECAAGFVAITDAAGQGAPRPPTSGAHVPTRTDVATAQHKLHTRPFPVAVKSSWMGGRSIETLD